MRRRCAICACIALSRPRVPHSSLNTINKNVHLLLILTALFICELLLCCLRLDTCPVPVRMSMIFVVNSVGHDAQVELHGLVRSARLALRPFELDVASLTACFFWLWGPIEEDLCLSFAKRRSYIVRLSPTRCIVYRVWEFFTFTSRAARAYLTIEYLIPARYLRLTTPFLKRTSYEVTTT